MKNTSKLISIVLALVLALVMAVPAFAEVASSEVTCAAGEEAIVEFKFSGIMAIGGALEFSNDSLFSEVKVESTSFSAESNGAFTYNDATNRVAAFSTKAVEATIVVKATVAADAKPGDYCDVTFVYETSEDGNFASVPSFTSEVVTVTVKGEAPVEIDYEELKKQIAIADGLTESKYTPDSWAKMMVAYEQAVAALSSQSQAEVDQAAKNLADAIAALVEITDDPNPPTNDGSFIIWTAVVVSGIALAGAFVFKKNKATK